jgi:hypothetical protein
MLASAAACLGARTASAEETRGYVVSWFYAAPYNDDKSCPQGFNPYAHEQDRRNLLALGYDPKQIEEWLSKGNDGMHHEILAMRGRIDGKPTDPFKFPTSVPDPQIRTVEGQFAHGFNLDGKVKPQDFVDPETKEAGVDNQLFRAIGCIADYHINFPVRPINEQGLWELISDTMPAYLISITGDDLSKDGDVTVRFGKSLYHRERDASGSGTLYDVTYVVDQKDRSVNNPPLHGQIRNGVLTLQQPGDLFLEGEAPSFNKIDLHQMQLRLQMKPDGSLGGYIGGYQPWLDFYFVFAGPGRLLDGEGINIPGMYYALKRMADADPDPQTGQNMRISATYRLEAVPAYLATPNGNIIAKTTP